jgi:class 3 adenylate cyclase
MVSGTGLDPRALATIGKEAVTAPTFKTAVHQFWNFDATADLPHLRCPTLVLHRNAILHPVEQSVKLAAAIPDGHLRVLTGVGGLMWVGDSTDVLRAIETFLLATGRSTVAPAATTFRTILFTDLVGHTEMMRRLGDERGRTVLREHEALVRRVLGVYDGTEVKTMGDGFMASFPSVTRAVECAIALQQAFEERNRTAEEPLSIRVGLNAGEPIAEDGDLFGETVILAARIASTARAGEILASLAVRELCAGKAFVFDESAEQALRGFEEPVRTFQVGTRKS